MNPPLFEVLYNVEQMADGSRQTVEPHHDEDVASGELLQHSGENGSGARCPGSVLLVNAVATSKTQLIDLRVVHLIVG